MSLNEDQTGVCLLSARLEDTNQRSPLRGHTDQGASFLVLYQKAISAQPAEQGEQFSTWIFQSLFTNFKVANLGFQFFVFFLELIMTSAIFLLIK